MALEWDDTYTIIVTRQTKSIFHLYVQVDGIIIHNGLKTIEEIEEWLRNSLV